MSTAPPASAAASAALLRACGPEESDGKQRECGAERPNHAGAVRAPLGGLPQQGVDGRIHGGVLRVADDDLAQSPAPVEKHLRRPVCDVVGVPKREVVVDCHGPGDAELRQVPDDFGVLAFVGCFRAVDSDDRQAVAACVRASARKLGVMFLQLMQSKVNTSRSTTLPRRVARDGVPLSHVRARSTVSSEALGGTVDGSAAAGAFQVSAATSAPVSARARVKVVMVPRS